MTQEKKVQTAAVMDVTGVERAAQDAVRAARTMAEGITREGEKAGKGIEAMGAGAERAERTVDAKTKSISDRIRRLTQQSQRELAGLAASSAGGAGSASSVEYEATIRGADLAKLQPQIAALRDLQAQTSSLAASMRQAMVGEEFIASVNNRVSALQRQAAAAKMTEADMLALRAAELGVAQQADPLIAKLRATAEASDQAAAASRRASAGDSFLSGLGAQTTALGKSRADLLEIKAAELGVTEKAAPMIAAIRAADGAMVGVGMSAKATAAAMRVVPAQFTDIVVSLQAGQNPLQVFLQQGGQLKDMFGGAGPAARALGTYVVGLINPFTAAAAVVALLGAAYISAQSEQGKLLRDMISTGYQAGVTANQMRDMATAVSAGGAGSAGKATELLSSLAKSGQVGADSLQQFTSVALRFEKAGGDSTEKVAENFIALGREPTAASAKLNKEVNFLTGSLYSQIKALEDNGHATDAARLAQTAYADALAQRTPEMLQSLGLIERAWSGIKDGTAGAWGWLKKIGQELTISEQIGRTLSQIQGIDEGMADFAGGDERRALIVAQRAALVQQVDSLRRVEQGERLAAAAGEQRLKVTEATARIEKLRDETLSKPAKLNRELTKYRADADLTGVPSDQRAKDEAAIREKYDEKQAGLTKALLAEKLAAIRAGEQERQAVYKQSETIIEAERQAGLLSEQEYYDSRRAFVELEVQSRVQGLQAEIAAMSKFKGTATEEAQVRKDIAKAAEQISQATSDAAVKSTVLTIGQTAAIEAQTRAMTELGIAAKVEYDALVRRLRLEDASAGMGSRRASEEAAKEQLAADFTRRQAQLEAERRNGRLRGEDKTAQYQQELTQLIQEEGKQLQVIEEFQRRKRATDDDYRLGAQRGIENVIDGTYDTAARTARLTEDAFKGLGDALTDVFTKGKVSWASLEQTIVGGITRIIIEQQLIRPIAQYLQGASSGGGGGWLDIAGSVLGALLGGDSTYNATGGTGDFARMDRAPGRASGGPVERGGLYRINETGRGPGEVLNVGGRQYLMALQNGQVQPVQGSTAAGSSIQQVNHFHLSGPIDRRTQQQVAAMAGQGVRRALARNT